MCRRRYGPRVQLETPLAELDVVPPPRARQLERFGLRTVGALLMHFPRRYEDRTQFDHFPAETGDRAVCVCGVVKKTSLRRLRGGQRMFDVLLEEENAGAFGGRLVCRWFNSHWVEKMIAQGHTLVVHGKPKMSGTNVVIAHPEFEIVEDDAEQSIHLQRIVPVHAATEGLTPRVLRRIVWDVLERLEDDVVPQLVPPALDRMPRAWALRQMHFPKSWDDLAKARKHLVLEEFLAMQLAVSSKRAELKSEHGGPHCGPGDIVRRLHASLPFSLTGAQQRAIAEIRDDLASARPMNRLLHGDVGSGKTLVAMSAMLLCVEAGFQAALMAPTQILAEQHFLNFRRLLEPLGIRVSLRTGARREDAGDMPLFSAANARVPGSTGGPPVPPGDPPGGSGVVPLPASTRYSRRNLPHFERPWAKYMITFSTRTRVHLTPEARTMVLDSIRFWNGKRYELYAACVMPDHVHFLIEPKPQPKHEEGAPPDFFPLPEILQSLKSYTAHEINKMLKRTGAVWEAESYDRMIRSQEDLEEKFHYILENPWGEKLVAADEDYPWVWWPGRAVATGSTGDPPVPSGGPPGGSGNSLRSDVEARPATGSGASNPIIAAGRRDAQAGRLCSPMQEIASAEPHIFIGTHALLYEGAGFSRLGLVVIDEQHKFGVMQRARLRGQGAVPDVLVMTATPIPRTLTMTLYGDLDVSTLDEMPAGRGRIVTLVRPVEKLPDAVKFIRTQLGEGRQAYIVYPLVEESERLEAKAATAEFEKWRGLLAPMPCGLLHGRVPPEEKDAVMAAFRRGETKALIATTVIEVGIDVPNANVMLVENAERFGLAQLHQLRGRIGRGAHKSYCVLLTTGNGTEALEKLGILEKTGDGFEIAEADLRLRGPGDLLGTAQSGLAPLKLGDLFADADLMKLARNHAFLIFERDPKLELPENAGCRTLLEENRRAIFSQVS